MVRDDLDLFLANKYRSRRVAGGWARGVPASIYDIERITQRVWDGWHGQFTLGAVGADECQIIARNDEQRIVTRRRTREEMRIINDPQTYKTNRPRKRRATQIQPREHRQREHAREIDRVSIEESTRITREQVIQRARDQHNEIAWSVRLLREYSALAQMGGVDSADIAKARANWLQSARDIDPAVLIGVRSRDCECGANYAMALPGDGDIVCMSCGRGTYEYEKWRSERCGFSWEE